MPKERASGPGARLIQKHRVGADAPVPARPLDARVGA